MFLRIAAMSAGCAASDAGDCIDGNAEFVLLHALKATEAHAAISAAAARRRTFMMFAPSYGSRSKTIEKTAFFSFTATVVFAR
jgi:hypothetical protein